MIAASYTQGGALEIGEAPMPELQEGDVLLQTEATSICGTDTKIVRNGHRKLKDGQKLILGHELAGVIVETRGHVRGLKKGMRVGVAPNWGCGQCEACIRGLANYCPDYSAFGIESDGSHAEYVRVPSAAITQGNVVELSEGFGWAEASLAEPFSCVVHAQRIAQVAAGDVVAIYGCGPMGLLHVLLAKAAGAEKIIAIGRNAARLESARTAGATHLIRNDQESVLDRVREITGGKGVDVVITAAPVAEIITEALELLATFGRLSLFAGLPRQNPQATINANAIHYKCLQVSGTTGGCNQDYRKALALIESGRVDVASIISHRYTFSQLGEAYEVALAGQGMKIVIQRG